MSKTKTKKKKAASQADGTRRSYFMYEPNELVIIGLDTKDGPEHPLYDERIKLPVSEALVRNIQMYGVLKPIIFERDGDRKLVVAGRQRVRAARVAAQRQRDAGEMEVAVPSLPKAGDATLLFGIARSENAHHQADGPIVNARNAQRMLDMGASEEVIAVSFGVTPATIRGWLKLLSLSPSAIRAVESGKLSAAAALPIAILSKADQDLMVATLIAEGGGKATAARVTNGVRAKEGKAPVETPRAKIRRLELRVTDLELALHDVIKMYEQGLSNNERDPDWKKADPMRNILSNGF